VTRLKNVRRTEGGRFEIFSLVSIRTPGPWWWHTEEFETADGNSCVIFRCFGEPVEQDEVAYLLVADVSGDQEEKDISTLDEAGANEFDKFLETGASRIMSNEGRTMRKWMTSKLNEIRGRKVLVTAYIARDGARDRQYIDCRSTVNGRKLVVAGCFDVTRADEFAAPIFNAMQGAIFLLD
jgi:hypothetical protein